MSLACLVCVKSKLACWREMFARVKISVLCCIELVVMGSTIDRGTASHTRQRRTPPAAPPAAAASVTTDNNEKQSTSTTSSATVAQHTDTAYDDTPVHKVRCIVSIISTARAILPRYILSSCVCLSQVGVVQRCLNLGSHKQRHTMAQGLLVF